MITLAMALVGIACGAMSVGAGRPGWVAPRLGGGGLAGCSEMLYVGLATATSPWGARPAALRVNARRVADGRAPRTARGRGGGRGGRAGRLLRAPRRGPRPGRLTVGGAARGAAGERPARALRDGAAHGARARCRSGVPSARAER